MSKITTRSLFFYGTTVSLTNRALDFSEGAGTLQGTLRVGDYTLTEFAAEVQRAMREAGTQAYTVSVNRATRALTISAPLNFSLLSNSGPRVGTSIWTLAGFSTSVDYTGANSYVGPNGAGSEYETQYPVDNYTSDEDNLVKENATYNVTPRGVAQIISYGEGSRITMDIRLISNLVNLKMPNFKESATGVAQFKAFMTYAMTKSKLEFMPNQSDRATYKVVFLESTQEDRNGFNYVLKNMSAPEWYRTGRLTFRKVL